MIMNSTKQDPSDLLSKVDPITVEARTLVNTCSEILARKTLTEEDFKVAFTEALHRSLAALDIKHAVRFEQNVVRSLRADALYQSVILEYKKPGKLADTKSVDLVEEQISGYLRALEGRLPRGVVGVALDGRHIVFVKMPKRRNAARARETAQTDVWGNPVEESIRGESSGRMEVSESTMERLLLLFRGLVKKTLSPEELVEDFGLSSKAASTALNALAKALATRKSPRVDTLYNEWRRLFGIVYGEKTGEGRRATDEVMKTIGAGYDFGIHEVLFIVHTYFALLMKMISAEVLSIQQPTLHGGFVSDWSTMSDDAALLHSLKDVESGGIFAKLGITNFLEGDFFGWYVNCWDHELAESIRLMAKQLANYEPATPTLEPEIVRDLLKKLYQFLVPKSVRHDLGEYYTPDWLAQLALREIGYDGNPAVRILDPACGSGTFLVEILQKITARVMAFPETYPDKDAVLDQVLRNVVGFDINPIAVLAARTNFIIALSSLRMGTSISNIQIPVYLSDSVLLPAKFRSPTDGMVEEPDYRLITSLEEPFIIPSRLTEHKTLAFVMETLEDVISYEGTAKVFLDRLRASIPDSTLKEAESELLALFNQMSKLEVEGHDRIWARIIKNSFVPLFVDRFDFVVGNPPWVNWEYLSSEYRKATSDLWAHYELVPGRTNVKKQFELGKTKRDFSMLFTYSVVDLYLKDGGCLGFLITQTVFKTSGGEVFRRFKIPPKVHLGVKVVHDLVSMNPFEGASNRTALLVLEKGRQTTYPVDYYVWNRLGRTPSSDADLTEAESVARIDKNMAEPVSHRLTDIWMTASPQALAALKKVLGNSAYDSHAGVTTWLNGIYFLEVLEQLPNRKLRVRNLGDVGKKKVAVRDSSVESDLVYVLLRGRDISRWGIETKQYALIPHTKATGWKAIDEETMMTRFPESFKFLRSFQHELENRPGKKQLREKHPFYILASIGEHTFEPFKVAWGSISERVDAAVLEPVDDPFLGQRIPMLEHSAMYLETSSWDDAHYVCALLNSTPAQATIICFKGMGSYGNLSRLIRIPKYDPDNTTHRKLSELSRQAHKERRLGNESKAIENEIDKLSMEIWELTEAELGELSKELHGGLR